GVRGRAAPRSSRDRLPPRYAADRLPGRLPPRLRRGADDGGRPHAAIAAEHVLPEVGLELPDLSRPPRPREAQGPDRVLPAEMPGLSRVAGVLGAAGGAQEEAAGG